MKAKDLKIYSDGFIAGLNRAYAFLYSEIGACELVRDTVERFREMQNKETAMIAEGKKQK